jgi:hypothetical protein
LWCAAWLAIPKHGVEDDQELAHGGGERELLGFARGKQAPVNCLLVGRRRYRLALFGVLVRDGVDEGLIVVAVGLRAAVRDCWCASALKAGERTSGTRN